MWVHVDTTSQAPASALVAGRPAVIVARRAAGDGRRAAGGGGDAAAARRRALTRGRPKVSVRRGDAVWHVRSASPGVRRGQIDWGGECVSSVRLTLVATSGSPTLRAVSAARFPRGLAVVLRARLPGVRVHDGRAYDAFFLDHPERQFSRGRGVGDLFFAVGRGQLTASGGPGFGPDGTACVRVLDPRGLAAMPYRIRFTWNHELGVRSIRRRGSVAVSPRPRTRAERSCARQFSVIASIG